MPQSRQIVFGTMRMDEISRAPEEWAQFFAALYDRGIRSIHSSDEYSSFGLLEETLAELRTMRPDCQFRHVVKLAEPSFDDACFDAERLIAKLASYCTRLSTKMVHDVQWMWRKDLKAEPQRIDETQSALPAIEKAVSQLKAEGKIQRFFCFPYSQGFADLLIEADFIDGFLIYRNAQEQEFDYILDRCAMVGKQCMIIRPFAAGATLGLHGGPKSQLESALAHPAIEAAILSTSSLDHIDQLLG